MQDTYSIILYPSHHESLQKILEQDKHPILRRLNDALTKETKIYTGELDRRSFCLAFLYLKDRYTRNTLTRRLEDLAGMQDRDFKEGLKEYRQFYSRFIRV